MKTVVLSIKYNKTLARRPVDVSDKEAIRLQKMGVVLSCENKKKAPKPKPDPVKVDND